MVDDDPMVAKIVRKQYEKFLQEYEDSNEDVDRKLNRDNVKNYMPFCVFLRVIEMSVKTN